MITAPLACSSVAVVQLACYWRGPELGRWGLRDRLTNFRTNFRAPCSGSGRCRADCGWLREFRAPRHATRRPPLVPSGHYSKKNLAPRFPIRHSIGQCADSTRNRATDSAHFADPARAHLTLTRHDSCARLAAPPNSRIQHECAASGGEAGCSSRVAYNPPARALRTRGKRTTSG